MENANASESLVINFAARALGPVSLFKASCDFRLYFNGICVQPGPDGVGCYVIGCNGHRLAVWYDVGGECSRQAVLTVSNALISAARKAAAKGGRIVLDGGRLVVVGGIDDELFVQAGKAEQDMTGVQYPDIFRVIPKESDLQPGATGCLSGEYVGVIGKAAQMLRIGGRHGHACGTWHFCAHPDSAHVTRFDNEVNFLVVTMPMRSSNMPVWNKLPACISLEHEKRSKKNQELTDDEIKSGGGCGGGGNASFPGGVGGGGSK